MFSGGSYDSEGDVYDYHLGVYDERTVKLRLESGGVLHRESKKITNTARWSAVLTSLPMILQQSDSLMPLRFSFVCLSRRK